MLIIRRKVGERILLGSDINVKVTTISGRSVRLAIDADVSVSVMRGEVYDAIVAANTAATSSNLDELLSGATAAAGATT